MSALTKTVFICFLTYALSASIGLSQVSAKKTASTKTRAQPLSSLYARLAFSEIQEIEAMNSLSLEPIVEFDSDSAPFEIHRVALERELDRVEQFDLKTRGDDSLHSMVYSALSMLYSHKSALYLKSDDKYGTQWLDCLKDVRLAISNRAYTFYGACGKP